MTLPTGVRGRMLPLALALLVLCAVIVAAVAVPAFLMQKRYGLYASLQKSVSIRYRADRCTACRSSARLWTC